MGQKKSLRGLSPEKSLRARSEKGLRGLSPNESYLAQHFPPLLRLGASTLDDVAHALHEAWHAPPPPWAAHGTTLDPFQ